MYLVRDLLMKKSYNATLSNRHCAAQRGDHQVENPLSPAMSKTFCSHSRNVSALAIYLNRE